LLWARDGALTFFTDQTMTAAGVATFNTTGNSPGITVSPGVTVRVNKAGTGSANGDISLLTDSINNAGRIISTSGNITITGGGTIGSAANLILHGGVQGNVVVTQAALGGTVYAAGQSVALTSGSSLVLGGAAGDDGTLGTTSTKAGSMTITVLSGDLTIAG